MTALISPIYLHFVTQIIESIDEGEKLLDNFDWLSYYGIDKFQWRDAVEAAYIEMESQSNCLLAKLFGSYAEGCDELGITWGGDFGFDIPQFQELTPDEQLTIYDMLATEWGRRINN